MMKAATQAATKAAKLAVRQASKSYGDLVAIRDCSFEVQADTIVSIVGPSGCGKTTLLWSMSGLHGLTQGEVLLDGARIQGPHAEIGLVFQEANLLPWRNLIDNVLFPFEIKRQKPDRDWIDHLLDRVGLRGFEKSFPRELSGGMQQRASIVRALSLRPSVLVLSNRPGTVMADHAVPFLRPRTLETMASREVFDLTNRIKADIYGLRGATKTTTAKAAAK